MSTIEKAAARLVKKRAAEREAGNTINDMPILEADTKNEEGVFSGAEQLLEPIVPVAQIAPHQALPGTSTQSDSDESEFVKSCELDFPWLEENGFLVPNHKNHQQGQEFRRIKRPLLLNLQPQIASKHRRPTNVIYITSALPAEGKTFVALNLALSLAGELDRSVLLVDGDAAKGDLSRWMGIYEELGLVDLLNQAGQKAQDATIETNVERLSVMSCGRQSENLDELYASDAMELLVDGLASANADRVVVIDGPPLLPTTEAAVLASLMGQTVVVVEANKTPQAAVEQAVDQLEGCQLISMLLNKVPHGQSAGYGYGYGYGYDRESKGQDMPIKNSPSINQSKESQVGAG